MYERFELSRLVVGPGFALGHDRQGDADYLRGFGAGRGFDVVEVEPVTEGGRPISSSRVRAALLSGEVEEAGRLLGAPYFMDGTVERGSAVGRRLGFPTANLGVSPGKCLPELGIYSGWLQVRESGTAPPPASGTGRPSAGTV